MRGPDHKNRTIVIGRTGTGKTVGALNLLAGQAIDKMPWVIIDYKGEEMLDDIQDTCKNVFWIKPTDKPPKKPGLYRMTPEPDTDDGALEIFLRRMYLQEGIGLFVDEGYAMPKFGKTPAFIRLLVQGRSKRIPMIMLYQRPVWMSVFAKAQANFYYVFPVTGIVDRKTLKDDVEPAWGPKGEKYDLDALCDVLPEYYGLWYDVGANKTTLLSPAPSPQQVIAKFQRKLGRKGR